MNYNLENKLTEITKVIYTRDFHMCSLSALVLNAKNPLVLIEFYAIYRKMVRHIETYREIPKKFITLR